MAKQENVFGQKTVTPKGKLFFFDIDSPNTVEKHPKNQYPSDKFDVTLGFPKTTDLTKLSKACAAVAKEAFGTVENVDLPFANGDEKSLDSMKGHTVIRAKSSKRPGLVSAAKERLVEDELDAGMWARMSVTPMSYTSGRSKGVTLILKNVQAFTELEYTSLGGGGSAEDDFSDDMDDI